MVLTISTTKFFLAEISFGDYNFHRWTSKPTEYYFVNSKQTCKPPELHTIMKKSNGTGLVLKICETKNNVWKKHKLSILNGIDNYIKIIKIKLDSASSNRGNLALKPSKNAGFRVINLFCDVNMMLENKYCYFSYSILKYVKLIIN